MRGSSKNSSGNSSRTASRPVTPPHAETLEAEPDEVDDLSPGGLWHQTFGEALSPSVKKRNIRLHERTPSKTHLGDESSAWLARHQESVRNKLEKKCARAIKRGVSPAKPHRSVPLVRLETGSWGGGSRQPQLVPVGTAPQLLLFEMEGLLVERFRRSMWSGAAQSHGRPGVVSGLLQLRRTFLICVICRSDAEVAQRVLAELNSRGLRFDLAYVLPTSSRRKSSPYLTLAAQEQLRADTSTASLEALQRRTLLVASLELERAELEFRMLEAREEATGQRHAEAMQRYRASTEPPGADARVGAGKLLCSPASRRSPHMQRCRPRLHHHVRLLMQVCRPPQPPPPPPPPALTSAPCCRRMCRLSSCRIRGCKPTSRHLLAAPPLSFPPSPPPLFPSSTYPPPSAPPASSQAVIMSEIAIWIELMYAKIDRDVLGRQGDPPPIRALTPWAVRSAR
jgi:hypothetical protein